MEIIHISHQCWAPAHTPFMQSKMLSMHKLANLLRHYMALKLGSNTKTTMWLYIHWLHVNLDGKYWNLALPNRSEQLLLSKLKQRQNKKPVPGSRTVTGWYYYYRKNWIAKFISKDSMFECITVFNNTSEFYLLVWYCFVGATGVQVEELWSIEDSIFESLRYAHIKSWIRKPILIARIYFALAVATCLIETCIFYI